MKTFTSSHGCRLATRIAAALVFTLSASAHAGTWGDAQSAFADYNDAAGLKLLQQAAQEGDARAVQAWGLALLHGPRLFPGLLQADRSAAAVWFEKLAQHCAAAPAENACSPRSAQRLAWRTP